MTSANPILWWNFIGILIVLGIKIQQGFEDGFDTQDFIAIMLMLVVATVDVTLLIV